MMSYDCVIYHNPCSDGTASAWVVKYFNPEVELIPCFAGKSPKNETSFFTDKNVVFVDIYPPNDYLIKLAKVAKYIIILDHHESNYRKFFQIEDSMLLKNVQIHFDNSRSGCMIAWDYFSKTKQSQRPWFINYIGDRDLWTWKLENSKEINNALYEDNHLTTDGLNKLYDSIQNSPETDLLKTFATRGAEITEFKNKLIDTTIKYYAMPCLYKKDGKTYEVWMYTGRVDISSEVGNKLMSINICDQIKPDFTVYWRYDSVSKQYWLSMRSTENGVDVSKICEKYGGGGHRNASGCSLSGDLILEEIFVPQHI